MARVAAVDLGTNSFLLLVADVNERGREGAGADRNMLKVVEDHCRVVRLGEGVHDRRAFIPEALARADRCLGQFANIIQKLNVDHAFAIATSAARDAKNSGDLLALGEKHKIPISVIEGHREAQLSFEGALTTLPSLKIDPRRQSVAVVDVGGGSTELIIKHPQFPLRAQSFDVGCVRLTEICGEDLDKQRQLAQRAFSGFFQQQPAADIVIAVAGTPTTLACIQQGIEFDEARIEGFTLTKDQLLQLLARLHSLDLPERKKMKGMAPERADVIVAGCVLLQEALNTLHAEKLVVSTRGLRFGAALHFREIMGTS